jgi:hypothetical protein
LNNLPTQSAKILLTSTLLSALLACATVPGNLPMGKITEAGLYSIGGEAPISMPAAPSGQSRLTSTTQLIASTTEVPLTLKTRFGFCFTLAGIYPDGPTELVKVVSHPSIRRADGTTGNSYTATRQMRVVNGSVSACEGYGFDHDYELVAGTWKFTVFHAGRALVMQQFTAK